MPDFAVLQGSKVESLGSLTASSLGTVLTSGTANVKGAWVQLAASMPNGTVGFYVTLAVPSAGARYLVDIGSGAAASEAVIVPNLHYANGGTGAIASFLYWCPVDVPPGSRLVARVQSSTNAATIRVVVNPVYGPFLSSVGFNRAAALGANTADSGLTPVDPGGTINVKGAYAQLTASTPWDIKYLVVGFGHDAVVIASVSYSWLVDVAIGAAASEQIIIPNLPLRANSSTDAPEPTSYGFPVHIPAGSRIAARCQANDITSATERLVDTAVWGFG